MAACGGGGAEGRAGSGGPSIFEGFFKGMKDILAPGTSEADLAKLGEGIRKMKQNVTGYNDRGVAYFEKGEWQAAAAHFRAALSFYPKHEVFRRNYQLALDMLAKQFQEELRRRDQERYDRLTKGDGSGLSLKNALDEANSNLEAIKNARGLEGMKEESGKVFDDRGDLVPSGIDPATALKGVGKPPWRDFVDNDRTVITRRKERDELLAVQQKKKAELAQNRREIEEAKAKGDMTKAGELMQKGVQITTEAAQVECDVGLKGIAIKQAEGEAKDEFDKREKGKPPIIVPPPGGGATD